MWKALVLLLAAPAAFAIPVYVDSQGREWLDVSPLAHRTWTEVLSVCSSTTGACDGVLAYTGSIGLFSDVDVTGYQWATAEEVRELFYDVAGLPAGSLDTGSATFSHALGYGDNVFEHFDFTLGLMTGPDIDLILNGFTRDLFIEPQTGMLGTSLALLYSSPHAGDSFSITGLGGSIGTWPIDVADASIGTYLYRKVGVVGVPEPGTAELLASALLGFIAWRQFARGGLKRQERSTSRQGSEMEVPTSMV